MTVILILIIIIIKMKMIIIYMHPDRIIFMTVFHIKHFLALWKF